MPTVLDIATYQQSLFIEALPGEGVRGIIHKASGANGGELYRDSGYSGGRNIPRRIRASGMGLGHYFFNGSVDAVQSANFFVDTLIEYQDGDPLGLDIESEDQQSSAWALRWFQQVRDRLGSPNLLLYTTQSIVEDPREPYWDDCRDMGVRLWIAAPNATDPLTGPWNDWTIHQYSWKGTWAGYSPLDTNNAKDDAWRRSAPRILDNWDYLLMMEESMA